MVLLTTYGEYFAASAAPASVPGKSASVDMNPPKAPPAMTARMTMRDILTGFEVVNALPPILYIPSQD